MSKTKAMEESRSCGGRLVTVDGRELPLRGAAVRADARGGVARVILEQRFVNPFAEPLDVTYSVPLPADGAVSGYAFTLADRRIVGEVDKRAAARQRFEEAIAEGRSAALLEQDRSSLFTQEIGNIPAGAEVVAEIAIDQRLVWLDEGAWEWRFPTVVAPRYLGAEGRVADAERVHQDVAGAPLPVRMALALTVRDALPEGRRPESPSHAVAMAAPVLPGGSTEIAFADEAGARLDRDVVVRWGVARPTVGLALDAARPKAGAAAYGLLTIVPPDRAAAAKPVARDLIVLLDTSGSMGGEPLDQARRVVAAMVDTLGDADRLELIEFSTAPRRWKGEAVRATAAARKEALAWLGKLRASGGTEMREGILEALAPLRGEAQRQVVLVSDGLIGFESEVVAAILARLPRGSRLHTVGVGSAVNRSLTGPAARAGRGVEVVIGLGEDPERAARRIVARTDAPLVVDLEVTGAAVERCAPGRLPDLFAGAPALVALELRPEGGEIVVRGRTAEGAWEQRLVAPPRAAGEGSPAVATLFGRELVEDLELALAAGGKARELDRAIEKLGLDFQVATRLTSWIAVSELVTVDPRDPRRKVRVPQELPHGMSAEGLGLRPAAGMPMAQATMMMPAGFAAAPLPPPAPMSAPAKPRGALGRLFKKAKAEAPREEEKERAVTMDWLGEADDAAPAPEARPRSGLRGKITVRKGRQLVVELTLEDELAWDPAGVATVVLADGSQLGARVVLERTTRVGTLAAGMTLRITFELFADLPAGAAPERITIHNGPDRAEVLEIEVG